MPEPEAGRPIERPHLIDRISGAAGIVSSLTLLAMTLIVGFEVGSRYLFNSPTIWAWDINVQLMMLLVMLGMADALRRDANVRVDVLTARLSPRRQAMLDALTAPVVLFVAGVMVWTGWDYAHDSWTRGQTASTLFAPPLWPIKFTLPLGAALLTLQALLKLARDLRLAFADDGREGAS
jgi:TRAP-type C4-dicarboxylate transport system permease small subunit